MSDNLSGATRTFLEPDSQVPAFLVIIVGLNSATGAPFGNLGFDDANTNYLRPGGYEGSAAGLLPDWQLYRGGVLQTNLLFNGNPLDSGYGAIISGPAAGIGVPLPVSGYALAVVGTDNGREPFSLVQRGTIPEDAKYLTFWYSDDGLPWSL